MSKNDHVIITAALAGGTTSKENNPAVPYSPEEFSQEARRALDAGASIVHVHAKDPSTGRGTPDMDKIRPVVEAILDAAPEIILNLSSAITAGTPSEDRLRPIREIRPEMASLNTSTMNFAVANHKTGEIIREVIFTNTFAMLEEFGRAMKEAGTKPEIEAYDPGGVYNALLIRKKGDVFVEPMHWQCVFGVTGAQRYTPLALCNMVDLLPEGHTWSVCGVGPNQVPALMQAVNMGGHLRVGLEDNVRLPNGELARSNGECVEMAVRIAELAGRQITSPAQTRELLGLQPK